ncbi:hypothetical protein [Paraburkholderia elongata]|uniref:Uncharacterized protein n=1 Tax=Paraburkholderia elongata TaxID=2675747 RepID=A0A972SH92_9BURK|nr:hypothetical protein [Paraburkholderia elongata]NPT55723.1 hypothetical protein [Paraburkholderia elongata]
MTGSDHWPNAANDGLNDALGRNTGMKREMSRRRVEGLTLALASAIAHGEPVWRSLRCMQRMLREDRQQRELPFNEHAPPF